MKFDFFNKILNIAKTNNNVRLVEMNGSRANPNIELDQYQDFDIVFYVADYEAFLRDQSWMKDLGDVFLSQTTLDQRDTDNPENGSFIYMLQFRDGTRLDLSIVDVGKIKDNFKQDSLSMILLDKDGYNLSDRHDESDYYVKKITKEEYHYCTNEFFWVVPYVAKGIARGHLFYALKHLDIIRKELENVIDWWIGHKHNYQVSVGKGKSRYEKLLPKDLFIKYEKTYASVNEAQIQEALYSALALFDELAKELAETYVFPYEYGKKEELIKFIKENYQ